MRFTPLESKIIEIARPVATDMALEVVSVKIIGEGGSQNVQVMAEDPNTGRLGIDDCVKLSRALSAVFDVEDPINGAYRLEISSPGIDRPLTRLKDFEKYVDFDVKLEIGIPNENGQKRFRGFIKGVAENIITIETDEGVAEIDFEALTKAKLVLTDDLIKRSANL